MGAALKRINSIVTGGTQPFLGYQKRKRFSTIVWRFHQNEF
jgi:hypothetical protein